VCFTLEPFARIRIHRHFGSQRLYRDPSPQSSVSADVNVGHSTAPNQCLGTIAITE